MYDTIIIGAGMSGLAAGIRLAHYDQKVCILERHYTISSGKTSRWLRKKVRGSFSQILNFDLITISNCFEQKLAKRFPIISTNSMP